MSSQAQRTADTTSRRAALTLALCLPSDVLLYLLLPMESQAFGITLAQAGVLLAANRLVRIFGYRHVLNFYARNGDRLTCMIAAGAAALCAVGNSVLVGFCRVVRAAAGVGLVFRGVEPVDPSAGDLRARRRRTPGRAFTRVDRLGADAGVAVRRLAGPCGWGRDRSF